MALPLITLPVAVRLVRAVARDEARALNASLAGTAKLLLVYGLKRRVGSLRGGELAGSAVRVLGASAIAGAASGALAHVLTDAVPGAVGRALPGIASAIVFGVLFLVSAWGLGARELAEVSGPIRRRLLRRRA